MPLRSPFFNAERVLYEAQNATDEEWDRLVFGRSFPPGRPWRPISGTDPKFTMTVRVRGREIKFEVAVDRQVLDGLPQEKFDMRIMSTSLQSMENALLVMAGISNPIALPDSADILGPVDVQEDSEDCQPVEGASVPMTDAQADKIAQLLSDPEESPLGILALAQRMCLRLRKNVAQHRRVRRIMITACDALYGDKDEVLTEEARHCFMSYGYALAVRLSKDDPKEWGTHRRAAMFMFDAVYTRNMYEEFDLLWHIVQATGLRNESERLDLADVIGVLEDEIEEISKFSLHLFFKNKGRADSKTQQGNPEPIKLNAKKLEEKVSGPIESLDEALICTACWSHFSSHNPPVTFGDGKSVCRGCVQKKRRQLAQSEELRDYSRVANWDLEATPTPLSEVFGGAPDLTLGTVLEIAGANKDDQSPDSSGHFKRLGGSLYREGKFQAALEAYNKTIELAPTAAVNYSNRCAVLLKMNRLGEARDDARKALALSKGKWAKAHFRVFECSPVVVPTKGMIIRKQARTRLGTHLGESELDEEKQIAEEPAMSEEEYLKTWRRRRSAIRAGNTKEWQSAPDLIVEALASLVRAYSMGEKAENHFRRTMSMVLLTDAKMFDELPETADKLEKIRKSSFTLRLARELFQCRFLSRTVGEQNPLFQGAPNDDDSSEEIRKRLSSSELDCTLCYSLLCEPTTLPCGHSFCLSCAVRAIDHSAAQGEAKCPMCRYSLKPFIDSLNDLAFQRSQKQLVIDLGLEHVQINVALDAVIRLAFPEEYKSRLEQTLKEEEPVVVASTATAVTVDNNLEADIPWMPYEGPLLACVPASLALWEPAERLMMRRLAFVKSKSSSSKKSSEGEEQLSPGQIVKGKFGICWETDMSTSKYGLLMSIDSLSAASDGALLVWSLGGERFHILSEETRDGYHTAHVRLLDPNAMEQTTLDNRKIEEIRAKYTTEELSSLLKRSREAQWEGTSEELLMIELLNYWEIVKQWNVEWRSIVDEAITQQFSALPYCIAMVLSFPDLLNYYLMFGKRTRDSFKERVRLVLMYGHPEGKQWTPNQDISDHVDLYPELVSGADIESLT